MALKKCPKCELNYIRGDAPYYDVCMRSMRRGDAARVQQIAQEEEILCSECGEAPAVEGYELCADCLREQKRQKDLENVLDADADDAFDEDDMEPEDDE